MRILQYFLPVCIVVLFTGCLDIDENVNVSKDGSGQFAMDVDMSQMVDMIKQYMSKEEQMQNSLQKMDTTIQMKDVVDNAPNLTGEQKDLLRPGSVTVQLDVDQKIFRTHMWFPFSSLDNLQKLYKALGDGSLGNAKLLGGLAGGGGLGDGASSPDINQFNGIYDIVCKDGNMSKTLNKEKFNKLMADPDMAQIKQAGAMGLEIQYTTSLSLPRPVRKVDNPLAKLSDDKKTVTIKYNLMDVFGKPSQFNYHIEY